MPSRPHGLKAKPKRKAWQRDPKQADTRTRGRRGVALRQQRLAAEPLCRHCKAEGVVTPSTVPDHILCLAHGGLDVDENIQCLCDHHHRLKSIAERRAQRSAY